MHLPGEERQQGRQAAVPVPVLQLRRPRQSERDRPETVAAQGVRHGRDGAAARAERLHGRRDIQPVRGQGGAVRRQVRAEGEQRAVRRLPDTNTDGRRREGRQAPGQRQDEAREPVHYTHQHRVRPGLVRSPQNCLELLRAEQMRGHSAETRRKAVRLPVVADQRHAHGPRFLGYRVGNDVIT